MLQKLNFQESAKEGLRGPASIYLLSIHRAEGVPQEQHTENTRALITPLLLTQGGGSTPGEASQEGQRLLLLPNTLQLKQRYHLERGHHIPTPGPKVMAQTFCPEREPALKELTFL